MRVVVAEDQPPQRAYLVSMLQNAGCEVLAQFTHGGEICDWFRDGNMADAIFTDIAMPQVDGIEAIRSLAVTPPVVFVTAYGVRAIESYRLKAFAFLEKPIFQKDVDEVIERIRHHLAESAPRVQVERTSDGAKVFFLLSQVSHIERDGKVIWLWVSGKNYRSPWTSISQAQKMCPHMVEARRGLLIAPDRVKSWTSSGDDMQLMMEGMKEGDTPLLVAERQAPRLKKCLNKLR